MSFNVFFYIFLNGINTSKAYSLNIFQGIIIIFLNIDFKITCFNENILYNRIFSRIHAFRIYRYIINFREVEADDSVWAYFNRYNISLK